MALVMAVDAQDGGVKFGGLCMFVTVPDAGVIVAEKQVVITVREFMQNHARLLNRPGREISGVGNLDRTGFGGIHAVLAQPVRRFVINRAGKQRVVQFHPDGNPPDFGERRRGDDAGDLEKLRRKNFHHPVAQVGFREQLPVHQNPPALDVPRRVGGFGVK